jgi:hypothetical protein
MSAAAKAAITLAPSASPRLLRSQLNVAPRGLSPCRALPARTGFRRAAAPVAIAYIWSARSLPARRYEPLITPLFLFGCCYYSPGAASDIPAAAFPVGQIPFEDGI